MPIPPILFDVERGSETIPAVGVMTKYPVLFILIGSLGADLRD